jgi:hypothetical protein
MNISNALANSKRFVSPLLVSSRVPKVTNKRFFANKENKPENKGVTKATDGNAR